MVVLDPAKQLHNQLNERGLTSTAQMDRMQAWAVSTAGRLSSDPAAPGPSQHLDSWSSGIHLTLRHRAFCADHLDKQEPCGILGHYKGRRLLLPGSRKRISVSCERLRALLPRFDGRREDMASVLEMSVQFLRLAGTLVPGWEQHAETRHKWQKDVLQLALATQTPAGAPDPGREAPSVTMPQTPPSCVAAGVDEGVAKVPDRLPVLSGSLEGRGGSAPSQVPTRSSPLGRAEPGFLADPEPGSQEPPDGPLEPWGSDVSCPSLALRDEVESIFPDFFAC
ncbi:hypothetical protein CB1_000064007 [Camelus ferus]|nr:hypothetical protein CB1_000064007 [Camelus ferus]